MPVAPVAPSVFSVDYTGSGQGAIVNQDGRTVNRIGAGGTRFRDFHLRDRRGANQPRGSRWQARRPECLAQAKAQVTVRIGGIPAQVEYAGGAPGQTAGLFQVNAKIPEGVPSGEATVEVQVGTATSQPGITVVVK